MMIRWLIFLFLLSAPKAFAQNHEGAIVIGNGGAGRAAIDASESLFMNPATVAHLKEHDVSLGIDQLRQDPNVEGSGFSISLSDGTEESAFPASLGYVQDDIDMGDLGKVTNKIFQFSMATFVRSRVAIGLGLHHKEQTTDYEKYSQNNADMGLLYTPFDNFGVGLVAYNVFAASSRVPVGLRNKSTQGLGFNYVYKNFIRTRLDFVSSDSDLSSMLGFESYTSPFFVIRVGYQNNAKSELNNADLGFSFVGPRFTIHYAYLMGLGSPKLTQHSIDLGVPF